MALNKKKTILADKISSLINAAPTNIISDDENEETKAKVVEHYEESDDSDDATRQSKIRKQNVQLLDELDKRYEGKKVSRKDVYKDHESNSGDEEPDVMEDESADEMNDRMDVDNDDEDDDLSDEDKEEELTEGSKDEDEDDGDDDDDDDEYEEEEGLDKDNPLYRERDDDANFKTMSAVNVKEEMEKGQCIKNQLRIWESLLEMRIKLQQCLAESNQMPQYDTHKNYRRDADFMKRTNEAKSKLTLLLDNMLNLQSTLWKQYPETKSINGNRREDEEEQDDKDDSMDEEIPSDTEDEGEEKEAEVSDKNVDSSNESNAKENNTLKRKSKFVEYEKILNKRHKSYVNYRNSVISKWDEKTRMATAQLKKGTSHTTIERIDFALSDKVKLLKMTQLKRSEYDVIGKSVPVSNDENKRVEEFDPEIFDDDDFYGQLLKDLIECKSSDIEPEQLQKYRIDLIDKKERERRKMKKDRKVDTRASKGRKVRYNVHNKLVNYMAPITVYDTWTDVSKNELYNSLFGKIKPVETIQH